MTLSRDLRRLGARLLAPALLATALLTACGGGTSQVQAFTPSRLIVFGDESSMLVNDGSNDGFKFGINDRSASTTGKCLVLPTFAQTLAAHYGFVFAECNPNGATPKAVSRAQRLARVEDAATGLARQVADQGDLGASDMVSVMIGSHDIIALYESVRSGARTSSAAEAEAGRLGLLLADQISAILRTGARAMVFTIPDLSLSPYAATAALVDPGAVKLLAALTATYNGNLRTAITPQDGRKYGLVLADDIVSAIHRLPGSYLNTPALVSAAACTLPAGAGADAVATALLGCTTTTLVTGASATSHLWASDRHLGPNAHLQIGNQAVSRAVSNPF